MHGHDGISVLSRRTGADGAFARGAATFVEGPDNEALPSARIAGSKNLGDTRLIFAVFGFDIRACVAFDAERFEERLFRPADQIETRAGHDSARVRGVSGGWRCGP